ncbi:hypothetical protein ACFY97_08610 [Streptomyces klenkii]|uniref:hypothetical protein n=1 Tax=Streptomyces klenkii TaxID=1420899 RepID=UPI0036E80BFF
MCETVPGYGKDSVMIAISLIERQSIPGVAALVDRDWSKPWDSMSRLAVRTDYYDIDATIFFTGDVSGRMVAAFCDRQKVKDFLGAHEFTSPADAAAKLALPLGVLRKLSHDNGWGLRVAGTPIKDIAHESGGAVDVSRLFDVCLKRSGKARVGQQDRLEITDSIEAVISSLAKPSEFCCGHDLNSALAYLMQAHWGARISKDMLERAMRGGFSCIELASTQFRSDIHSVLGVPEEGLFNCDIPRRLHSGVPPARESVESVDAREVS